MGLQTNPHRAKMTGINKQGLVRYLWRKMIWALIALQYFVSSLLNHLLPDALLLANFLVCWGSRHHSEVLASITEKHEFLSLLKHSNLHNLRSFSFARMLSKCKSNRF